MRRLQIVVVTLLLIVAVAFGACMPKLEPTPAAAPTPVAVAPAPKVPVKEAFKEPFEVQWERLVDAAQKEGAVVWYTSLATTLRRPVADAFNKRFGIRVESITGRAADLTERILSERRAGIYGVDIITEGSGPIVISYIPNNLLQPIKPVLILSEATDPELVKKTWWQGKLPLVADYGIPLVKFASVAVLINTDLVKPGEVTSYIDLLKPEWKEKILMDDPTTPGKGAKWFALVGWEIMGMDWMQKFVQQKPVITRDRRALTEWVARGKFRLSLNAREEITTEFLQAYPAPVKFLRMKEGNHIGSGGSNVGLMDRAPHPNAAKLFINWLLTTEGMTLIGKTHGTNVVRSEIGGRFSLVPEAIPQPGDIESEVPEILQDLGRRYEMAKEVFAPILK